MVLKQIILHVIHEVEINSRVIVLQKQMLKYNKETFGRFMQNLTREHEERIKGNNQLRYEINKIKAQVCLYQQYSSIYIISLLSSIIKFWSMNGRLWMKGW